LKAIETENLESFDPVTQEQYWIFTCNNPHTMITLAVGYRITLAVGYRIDSGANEPHR
jgi:hypothetical protein